MKVLQELELRGLDVELASKMGLVDGGDHLTINFVRSGEVVRRKYRTFGPDKKFWQDKSAVRIAFNEDVLRDESLLSLPLIITEGELDAVAAVQAGFLRTISVPDGAPPPGERGASDLEGSSKYAWMDDIRAFLTRDRCPEIIIASDGDENGAALLQDLSVLLGRFRCKFLTYPKFGDRRLKDLNEVLQHYGVKGVVETVNRAEWIRVDGVYRMSQLPPLAAQVLYEPPLPRFRLMRENFKLRLGDFSVWTGTPGFGKTTFVNDLFCSIAQANDLTIAWASFEQEPQRDHRRNLRSWFCETPEWKLDADQLRAADRWIEERHVLMVPGEDDDATLEWLLDKMEASVVRYGASVIVLDPWNEIEHSRQRDESETEYIGRAIRKLKRFAKAFRVHVAVIAHPTKSVKDGDGKYKMPTLYDINGSANWYNKADLGVIVHRENDMDTVVKIQKSRYHEIIGKPGEVNLHFCNDTRRFTETERLS